MPWTFEAVGGQIPTWSHNPTKYRPRFQPLWSPETALNPTTSEHSNHLFSFTSIQWAIIPRNDAFVLSAVHPSAMVDIMPGAAYNWRSVSNPPIEALCSHSPGCLISACSTTRHTCYGRRQKHCGSSVYPWSSISASLWWDSFETWAYLPQHAPISRMLPYLCQISCISFTVTPGHYRWWTGPQHATRPHVWMAVANSPLTSFRRVWIGSLPSASFSLPAFASKAVKGEHDDSRVCSSPCIASCKAHNGAKYVDSMSSYHLYKRLFSSPCYWCFP